MQTPDIYQYNNYRRFLKDLYHERKKQYTRYSYLKFSADLKLGKTSYINLVLTEHRNLSLKAMEKMLKIFSWSAQQKRYFKHLVLTNQARSSEEREKNQKILDSILGKRRKQLHPNEYAFFNNWYIPVIRELVSFKKTAFTDHQIAQHIVPSIGKELVQKGLDVLQQLGMIQKEKGRWVQTDEHLDTHPDVKPDLISNYHSAMIKLAHKALGLPAKKREINAMTLGLSQKQFEKLRQKVVDFLYEIQQDVDEHTEDPTMVAQLNIQLFPTAESKK